MDLNKKSGTLQEQMAKLSIDNVATGQQPIKKLGPAVPPKPKKPQPQVPTQTSILNGPSQPAYNPPHTGGCVDRRARDSPIYSNIEALPDLRTNEVPAPSSSVMYSNLEAFNQPSDPYTRRNDQHQAVYSNIGSNATYSNAGVKDTSTYSNIAAYANLDDLPPPPPEPVEYSDFPPPPADLPPPPSPVSSSYSELRRATHTGYQPDYSTYSPPSQTSSTYESIYEPINPRPPSGMSSRSNYSLYAPYVKGTQPGARTGAHIPQEAEVDALTDLLVQSMDSSTQDSEVFGDCVKCGKRVVGEGTGCTAMDQVYHISCFTCVHCHMPLKGKPSYTLEGLPYCEAGYLDTLEKCSVCLNPILDRILRATGRPYHPHCFCCIVCHKSLDGIPFTVDATNQIYCIEDFHKQFAPRCCVCNLPIMPEPGQDETVRVVALDKSFHVQCYKCEDCGLVLSTEAEGSCYPLDDHVLCKSCNAKRVQKLSMSMTTEL